MEGVKGEEGAGLAGGSEGDAEEFEEVGGGEGFEFFEGLGFDVFAEDGACRLAECAALAVLPGSGDLFTIQNEIEMYDIAAEGVFACGGIGSAFRPSPMVGGADMVEKDVFLKRIDFEIHDGPRVDGEYVKTHCRDYQQWVSSAGYQWTFI